MGIAKPATYPTTSGLIESLAAIMVKPDKSKVNPFTQTVFDLCQGFISHLDKNLYDFCDYLDDLNPEFLGRFPVKVLPVNVTKRQ